jgi:hypothetical protein
VRSAPPTRSARPCAVANAIAGSMNQPTSTSHQSSGLTYRRLPSANYKCLLYSFLNVGNKLLVA